MSALAMIRALEERVAFAELARDNACKMRDDADTRRRLAGESAGKRINALVRLARDLGAHHPVIVTDVEERIEKILAKDATRDVRPLPGLEDL